MQAPVYDFEGILHNVMANKPHKRKNKILVDLCVASTTVRIVRVESGVRKNNKAKYFRLCEGSLLLQEILCENDMEVVEFFCSFPRDKRVLFYAIRIPSAGKTLFVCLRTLKNDRTVTVSNAVKLCMQKFTLW